MFYRKQVREQIQRAGVRLGDCCSILPSGGKKKAFTLNRYCIDLISRSYRPENLSMGHIELPHSLPDQFHYRLELDVKTRDEGRFVLKTIKGKPFWLNGLAVLEAYVERSDKLYIEDHKVHFDPFGLDELTRNHFSHPVLQMHHLMQSNLKILIEGETGTGKTYLARQIHKASGLQGNFVAVNLSSFNPMLIESELFGHRKGSFTGAIFDKRGAFAVAENGTLFLDEVDSLPLEVQVKLLTFLDSKCYRRVGDTFETEMKTRLIFATGRPLEVLVQKGAIRKDFYYRLKSGHVIELLPLRSEVKRINEACQYFALKHQISFSERILDFYKSLPWPGNLRQLFGHLEKKRILSKSTKIDFDQVDEELLLQSTDLMGLSEAYEIESMEQCKMKHLKRTVNFCEGNISKAAKKLRLSEKTVRNLLLKAN